MMQNKIKAGVGIITYIIAIILIPKKYILKEGTLYSQEVLAEYEDLQPNRSDMITRMQALEMAQNAFDKNYGVNLNNPKIQMYINLYKEAENTYKWVMSWYDAGRKAAYSCSIDALSGSIIELYANEE